MPIPCFLPCHTTPFLQAVTHPILSAISSSLSGIGLRSRANQQREATPTTMASEWWWFLVLNAIVTAIAILSQVRPPSSPRGGGITRRASSAVLQRLRSSLFSFPSIGFHAAPAPLPQPEPVFYHETEELVATEAPPSAKSAARPRALAASPPPATSAVFHAAPVPRPQPKAVAATVSKETEAPSPAKPASTARALAARSLKAPSAKEVEMEDDPNAMSMEEAYALVQAAQRRPEPERNVDTKRSSDVDAKAEKFIQGFKEDLRQQRLNSIFNYTQMLKKRAFGGGGGRQPPAAQPDQH